ncbi:MAG: nucleoside kinase [Anaerolineales bacterium]
MAKTSDPAIQETQARPSVQIHLPGGRVLEGERGLQLAAFLNGEDQDSAPIVGAIVNGQLRELTYPIELESEVRPVTMAEEDGMRIYRRSLTFLLAAAFEALFPEARLDVEHSVAHGGYHCHVSGRPQLRPDELATLENRMRDLVDQDLRFAKTQVQLPDAIEYFESKGFMDKARLLSHRRKPQMIIYEMGGLRDYHHGYMLPTTGRLQWFALTATEDGFTLRFPKRASPTELLPPPHYPKLLLAFGQYGDWIQTLGVASVGALNDAGQAGRMREVILVSEALHEQRIAEIAAQIHEKRDAVRLVLVAGPSASGKTTFAKRLSLQLLALGISPMPIGLDNFFVDREKTPKDERGDYDYERLDALDIDRLNHDMRKLAEGEQVQLPEYDFIEGVQRDGQIVQISEGYIVILEGIHGLNPELLPELPEGLGFRIYASALTQLNLDRYNRVSTTDTRLVRRLVRDARHRGKSAADTISRWESVRRGERLYIFPFQENADVMFNSALVYEGAALAPLAEPLLRQVTFGTPEHVEAKRLLSLLEWFAPIDDSPIPDNSILREFMGGSILRDFTVGGTS